MNFIRRLFGNRQNSVDDPVLGELTRHGEQWVGQTNWPYSRATFSLVVHRAPEPPSDADRRHFEKLRLDYPSLAPAIEAALFSLWRTSMESTKPSGSTPTTSADVWAKAELRCVELYPDAHVELTYGFTDSSCGEGTYLIAVRGTVVEPVDFDT